MGDAMNILSLLNGLSGKYNNFKIFLTAATIFAGIWFLFIICPIKKIVKRSVEALDPMTNSKMQSFPLLDQYQDGGPPEKLHQGKPHSRSYHLRDYLQVHLMIAILATEGRKDLLNRHLLKHQVQLEHLELYCGKPGCLKPFTSADCLKACIQSCHEYIRCEVCGTQLKKKNFKRHQGTHESFAREKIKCSFEGCEHAFSSLVGQSGGRIQLQTFSMVFAGSDESLCQLISLILQVE